jgi:hypothetical protein
MDPSFVGMTSKSVYWFSVLTKVVVLVIVIIEACNVWSFVFPTKEGAVDCAIKNVSNTNAATTKLNKEQSVKGAR